MKNYYLTILTVILFLCSPSKADAQKLLHQDIFHGGVTAAGFSGGIGGVDQGQVEVHIEPGSTIRKAYLFLYTAGNPPKYKTLVNSISVNHSDFELIGTVSHSFVQFLPIKYYFIDISNIIDPTTLNYTLSILPESTGPDPNWGWWCPVIYIEYENPGLDKIATSLWVNDQDLYGQNDYVFENFSTIDLSSEVGFSVFTDRACNNDVNSPATNDGNEVFVNGTSIGVIGEPDSVVNEFTSPDCSGSRGHFYYQNQTLYGLNDDTPNSIMNGADALADISNYLISGTNPFDVRLKHTKPFPSPGNPNTHMVFPLAYSTPCDTFSTQIISDTSVCIGDSLQLFASGGTNYEWLNNSGMNNPTISNPKVSPDSSQLYVVRIENSPGCYRTEQVLVKLHENPIIDSIRITPETCGDENGEVKVWKSGNAPFTNILGATSQSSGTFSNLVGDTYNLEIEDNNGCSVDTTITVPIEINVEAGFNASPESGFEPLSVDLINTSQNATDYEWFIDDSFWDNSVNTSTYFDSTGNYQVTLYAYNNRPECVDSASFTIIVKDTIFARIPNIITPNDDGVNDVFTIDVRRAEQIEAQFFNRWGNEVNSAIQKSNGLQQTIPLWDGKTSENKSVTEGTYFYTITITSVTEKKYKFQGHVQVSY